MKTAISIPDTIFQEAEQLAHRLGVSRSELYVTAITQYLEAHREQDITERLDGVYGDIDSALDSAVLELQRRSLPSGDW
jgi:metal-responsive CopG/Arc/MetJ family transcriptional regulator